MGGLLPYWSLYLEGQGYTYLQIATLMATIQLTKIVAPSVWGWLGDRSGQRVRLVRFGAITGSLFFAGVFLEPGFYGLLLVMLAFTFFWNAILPLRQSGGGDHHWPSRPLCRDQGHAHCRSDDGHRFDGSLPSPSWSEW